MVISGASERIRRERNDLAWAAWHIAALSRAKRLPALDKLLDHGPKGRKAEVPRDIDHARVRGFFIGMASGS